MAEEYERRYGVQPNIRRLVGPRGVTLDDSALAYQTLAPKLEVSVVVLDFASRTTYERFGVIWPAFANDFAGRICFVQPSLAALDPVLVSLVSHCACSVTDF